MTDVIANREPETLKDEASPFTLPSRPARRRWTSWLAVGLVVALAVGVQAVWRSSPDATALVLVREVPPGHELLAEDVRQVAVSGLEGVDVPRMPAAVVGRTMAVPAPRGSVLTAGMIGAAVFPQNGTALVGVSLPEGAYPPEVAAGARVGLVATRGAALSDEALTARVLAVRPSAGRGALVTLQLAQWHAFAVAAAGAQHRVSLIGLPHV